MSTGITRRAVLRGGVSTAALLALLALPASARAPAPTIPTKLYQPGIEAMAGTVKAIVDMLKPSIVGVDYTDLRAILQNGGRAAFGQGIMAGAVAYRR